MSTERKIQDYLHLYGIECPIMTPDGEGSVLVIYPKAVEVSLNVIAYKQEMKGRKGGGEMHYKYFYSDVKLILRNLSDMTEEEGKHIGELILSQIFGKATFTIDQKVCNSDDEMGYIGKNEFGDRVGLTVQADRGIEISINGAKMMVRQFDIIPELLSLGFDLFGLFEAGLAIKKQTKEK